MKCEVKHNGDMGMGHFCLIWVGCLWLNGWGISALYGWGVYGLMGGAFMAYNWWGIYELRVWL